MNQQGTCPNSLKSRVFFLCVGALILMLTRGHLSASPLNADLKVESTLSITFRGNTYIKYPFGAIQVGTIWSKPEWSLSGDKPIEVCWEKFSDSSPALRATIRDAVSKTWQHYSMVSFINWSECKNNSSEIRIGISATESKTLFLGNKIAGIPNGMILRIDYSTNKFCIEKGDYCVRATAIHEFGHALGLAHEQNRSDADSDDERVSWCIKTRKQGDLPDFNITLYDPQSIMNYCNKNWNNKGLLSDKDIEAVTKLYGSRL